MPTKTKPSRRDIPLPAPPVEEFRAHFAAQAAERLAAGEAWTDQGFVFARPDGLPIDPKDDGNDWRTLLDSAGVRRVRLHGARRTAATLLLLTGVDERTVMDLMGWTEQRTAARTSSTR